MQSLESVVPNVRILQGNPEMLFLYLLTSEGDVARMVGKFCSDAFDARNYAKQFMALSPKPQTTKSGRVIKRRVILDL